MEQGKRVTKNCGRTLSTAAAQFNLYPVRGMLKRLAAAARDLK